uniref:Class I SAM-dependent methyltransferase n=1 Tax=Desulfovibrio desulfuricans (strain ATCC 27774 / DSM 6949 / MB) TaxID=525146 RepID=B8J3T1_DESDA
MKWYSWFNPKAYLRKSRQLAEQYCEQRKQKMFLAQYNLAQHIEETRRVYAGLGLDFDAAQASLKEKLASCPALQEIDPVISCASEHWTFFAALAQSQRPIKRILELGTYNGETTHLLAKLFPDAQVTTVDLPATDPIFIASYGRQDPGFRQPFLEYRARMLDVSNIELLEINSFLLPSLKLVPFDLIWVDACHEFPEVGWDMCNAYHLLQDDGLLMCDDIYMNTAVPQGQTHATLQAVKALEQYRLIDLFFIIKRLDAEWSADPAARKHIAVARKPKPSTR